MGNRCRRSPGCGVCNSQNSSYILLSSGILGPCFCHIALCHLAPAPEIRNPHDGTHPAAGSRLHRGADDAGDVVLCDSPSAHQEVTGDWSVVKKGCFLHGSRRGFSSVSSFCAKKSPITAASPQTPPRCRGECAVSTSLLAALPDPYLSRPPHERGSPPSLEWPRLSKIRASENRPR